MDYSCLTLDETEYLLFGLIDAGVLPNCTEEPSFFAIEDASLR